MSIIRPENKQVVNPETGRLNLEWDAYFSRFEKILDYIGASQGDILYRGANNWQALGSGIANQRLITKGASANPVYGGGVITIASGSLPSAASFDITNIPNHYLHLNLFISNISHNSGADQRPVVRASTDNGSTFNTGSYRNSSVNTYNSTVFTSPSTDSMISDIVTRASSSSWNISLDIFNYHGGSYPMYIMGMDVSGVAFYSMIGHFFNSSAINALRITFSSVSIDSGTYALFGFL